MAKIVGAERPTLLRAALSLIVGVFGSIVGVAAAGGLALLLVPLAFLLAFKFILGTSLLGAIGIAVLSVAGYAAMIHFIGTAFTVSGNGVSRSNSRPAHWPVRARIACTSVLLLVAGCGQSANTPVPTSAAVKPDVIVTLDGPHQTCVVALTSEAQGSTISCNDLVPFMRDELRLASGSVYDIRTIPTVDEAQLAKIKAGLKDAGYRFIGGPQ